MEYLKSALANIKQNKGRSFLTMLGIIIGIASVISILSIGNGMKSYVNTSLDEMSNGAVTIQIDPKKTDRYLTADDLEVIEDAIPDIYGATPSYSAYVVMNNGREDMNLFLNGGKTVIEREESDGMYKGHFFREDDVENVSSVCVMPQATAILLYGTDDVLDKTFEISYGSHTDELKIIGITKSEEERIERMKQARRNGEASYYYSDIYVPYTLITQKYGLASDRITSYKIYTHPGTADEAALKAKSVTESLLALRGEGAVSIQSFASMAAAYNNILNVVTLVVALIAAISLIVGGIGVMNIMTVTVTERTREIGIRKSLGARTSYILMQFLTESAVITLIGGAIGMLLGFIFTKIAAGIMPFPPVISPMNVLMVVAISTADGLFFGIYPARRAAKLDPIEALRQE